MLGAVFLGRALCKDELVHQLGNARDAQMQPIDLHYLQSWDEQKIQLAPYEETVLDGGSAETAHASTGTFWCRAELHTNSVEGLGLGLTDGTPMKEEPAMFHMGEDHTT